jgi:hypothetical protein
MGDSCDPRMAYMHNLCATRMDLPATILAMMHTEATETRTLTIVLPESDWRALRAQEPDAIAWLQAQIRRRLDATASAQRPGSSPSAATADSWWGDDY